MNPGIGSENDRFVFGGAGVALVVVEEEEAAVVVLVVGTEGEDVEEAVEKEAREAVEDVVVSRCLDGAGRPSPIDGFPLPLLSSFTAGFFSFPSFSSQPPPPLIDVDVVATTAIG
jgi:hypothetical protein